MKRCPYCREYVHSLATKCKHCHEELSLIPASFWGWVIVIGSIYFIFS